MSGLPPAPQPAPSVSPILSERAISPFDRDSGAGIAVHWPPRPRAEQEGRLSRRAVHGTAGIASPPDATILSPSSQSFSPPPMTAAAWTLEVRGHELARNPKDGAQFAVFCVQVTTPEGPYTVKRRFQAFLELHKQVCEFALAKLGRTVVRRQFAIVGPLGFPLFPSQFLIGIALFEFSFI